MTRSLALFLTVLTGGSGLVYQVAWQKYLASLLGSHSEATAIVLGIFLGGLSTGYAVFGWLSGRLTARAAARGQAPRLLFAYGVVEATIGAWALLFPALFAGVRALSLWIPFEAAGLVFASDVVLTVVLIGPPTVLMGGTIPLLTQSLARDLDDATRLHAWVYAFNTAGAFFGALGAGFFLVPALGLSGCVVAMGVVNLVAGAPFLAVGRARLPQAAEQVAAGAQNDRPALLLFGSVALLAGFAMMTIQTVMNRIGGLALGSSHFTFAMVVATFVLSIALGSFAVSALSRIRPAYLVGSQWLLGLIFLAMYPVVEDAPYWAHRLRILFPVEDAGFYPYYTALFGAVFSIFVVPLALSGATLPLLFHHLRNEQADLGAVAGRLYAWNTVGSLCGALLGGYALLFWLDLHHVYRLAVFAILLAASLLTLRIFPARTNLAIAVFAVTSWTLFAMLPWSPDRLSSSLFRKRQPMKISKEAPAIFFRRFLEHRNLMFSTDDPSTTVAVFQHLEEGQQKALAILTNGKSDGAIPGDNRTTGLAALLPALFTEPKRAFVIGYGTGYTVGVLNGLESVEEVVVAEISSGVVEAAAYFEPFNRHAAADPKTRIVQSDAYRALLRSEGTYDVMVSEPSNPWMAGVEMLFSRDFLAAARTRLRKGGVYAQWMHAYETDRATFDLVLNTFRDVFDRVAIWRTVRTDVIILGFDDALDPSDLARVRHHFELPGFRDQLRRIGIHSLASLLAHELLPIGVIHELELGDDVHTILHPLLSHRAARGFFAGQRVSLPTGITPAAARVGAENALLRRLLLERGDTFSDEDYRGAIAELCAIGSRGGCISLLTRWQAMRPTSRAMRETLDLARKQSSFDPPLAETFSQASLDRTAWLLGLPSAPRPTASWETASRLHETFRDGYFHALPFHRDRLIEIFDACDDPRCREARKDLDTLGAPALTPNE